ncbi:UNVERIFIED_CONTAM: hypothetical protein Sangu_1879000, partial [Sesamum angustifolium]
NFEYPYCKTLEVQCGRHAHWTRQPVTTGVSTGVCGSRQTVCWLVLVSWHRAGAQHMAHCWAGRGTVGCGADRLRGKGTCRPGVGQSASADGRAWASRRPCAETFGRLCARARADADGSRRLADGRHRMRPMCRKTRQAGRQCSDGLGSARTRSAAAKDWWLATYAEAYNMCGTCDGTVKAGNRLSTWQ